MARKPRSNRQRRSGPGRASRPPTNRHFPRTARLNTLLQEIVADYFERVEDERFEMLTIIGVEVDNDLNRAQVFVSDLGYVRPPEDEESDEVLLDALADHRKPVQAKIGRESRIRKTPEVVFAIDPGVRAGARIEEILSDLRHGEDTGSQDLGPPDSGPTPEDGATVEGDGSDDDGDDNDGDDNDEASKP
jgi:ribosome-binding factor A